uniref:DUF5710 domain-containing protein n=1 Tax=Ruegeria arenilitoris TaxID=1173585 RepID=UPI001C2B91C8|nr:DUF5710 domain-containing protein [Ruegeria arenilitoris]
MKDELATVSAAGTYKTWRKWSTPSWAGTVTLRPLDDPRALAALDELNKKRHKKQPSASNQQVDHTERVALVVPYARKDEAKSLGARWSPIDKHWWLPTSEITALEKAAALGFLPNQTT